MWDLGTALLAGCAVVSASLLIPPLARRVGGILAIFGVLGVVQGGAWAPTVAALGVIAWFVGHWSFAVRHDVRYRSRLALWLIDKTPLRWTIPRYWPLLSAWRANAVR